MANSMNIDEFKIIKDLDKLRDKYKKIRSETNNVDLKNNCIDIICDLSDIKIELCKHNSKYHKD